MGDVARGQQRIGRPALSTRLAAGSQTTTVRTTGKRTSSVPLKAGKLPLLPATVVARGKLRPLLTLLPLPQDPPQSTMPSLLWTLLDLPLAQLRSTMPSLALISLDLRLAPLLSTMLRPSSTSSRRRLTSLPEVDWKPELFHFTQDIFSSLRHQRQERSIVVEACPLFTV